MRSERRSMTARLVLIGLVAGVFSTLFGVGGGIVVVPLLIALAAFPHSRRRGDLTRSDRRHRDGGRRRCTRCMARCGPYTRRSSASRRSPVRCAGTHMQQRLSGRALSLAFAGLLVVIGVWLIAG